MKTLSPWLAAGAACLLIFATTAAGTCSAGTFRTIYTFPSLASGAGPLSNLIFENGMIYGNTGYGGTGCAEPPGGCGTLFQLDPATGAKTLLHSFLSAPDGGLPQAGPLFVNGKLYGATTVGGTSQDGAVYACDPATGAESVVLSFNVTDGAGPGFGQLAVHDGILYGVTYRGGTYGGGVIFQLDTATGIQTVLHDFGQGTAGYQPYSGILYHGGILYGTTSKGGDVKHAHCLNGCGTLFQFDLKTKALTVLFSFEGGRSGGTPFLETLIYQDGAIYGVTATGGATHKPDCIRFGGCGVVYKFDLAANKISILHRFKGGTDGYYPTGGLLYLRGSLYGTTAQGGFADSGTVYKINATTGAKTLLHSFRKTTDARDGTQPAGGLTLHDGKLYGAAAGGGEVSGTCGYIGCGTIFEVSP